MQQAVMSPTPRGLRARPSAIVALGILAVAYVLFLYATVNLRGLFDYVGIDYLAFRSSAAISRELGFAAVYDLQAQETYQRPVSERYAMGPFTGEYQTIPVPYLPVFIPFFLPLLAFDPVPGFLAWTLFNLAALTLYLWRFSRAIGLPVRFSLSALLAFPVLSNLQHGQVNVWLAICLGEFLLALTRKAHFTAGLWLAGLLLKPQALIVILPALLLTGKRPALAGFSVAAAVVIVASLLMAGPQGAGSLAALLLGYTSGLPTNYPESMMNWRAFGIAASVGTFPAAAWPIAFAGMAITYVAALAIWRRRAGAGPSGLAVALLAAYGATASVAWHSHVHMALPVIPILLYCLRTGCLVPGAYWVWLLVPTGVFLLAVVTAGFGPAHLLAGWLLFMANVLFVWWGRVAPPSVEAAPPGGSPNVAPNGTHHGD